MSVCPATGLGAVGARLHAVAFAAAFVYYDEGYTWRDQHINPYSQSPACVNCGSQRTGRFCADCGERLLTAHDLSLSKFLFHDLPHETFHLDGKLPRTLKALFMRPGYLAAEYVAGRRARFINPLRIYLLVFLVHAFVTAVPSHSSLTLPQRAEQIDPTGWVERLAAERSWIKWDDPVTEERITGRTHWTAEGGTLLIFLLVAAVQMIILRVYRRRYLEHAVLALGVSTFYMLMVMSAEIVLKLHGGSGVEGVGSGVAQALGAVALMVYWYLAVRRFYGASRLRAAIATMVFVAAQTLIAVALNVIVLALLVVTT